MLRVKHWLNLLGGVLLACQGISAQVSEPGPQPKTTAADLIDGQRVFEMQCAYCHGPKGEGGQGANLALPRLPHAPDDQALFRVIREGIPGTKMPASVLTRAQIWHVTAFVRTLGVVERSAEAGDPKRGEQVYAGKGACARCHTIHGHGGAIGPDLTEVGDHQNAAFMRTALIEPEASLPRDFLQVRVVTKQGSNITGVRLNEDAFSIQIRDLSNQFHSFWKSELTELVKEPKRSPMPSYKITLTAGELDDLIAYLESLRGNQ